MLNENFPKICAILLDLILRFFDENFEKFCKKLSYLEEKRYRCTPRTWLVCTLFIFVLLFIYIYFLFWVKRLDFHSVWQRPKISILFLNNLNFYFLYHLNHNFYFLSQIFLLFSHQLISNNIFVHP